MALRCEGAHVRRIGRGLTAGAAALMMSSAVLGGSAVGAEGASAWPKGCKVTVTPGSSSTSVRGVCPSNKHITIARCQLISTGAARTFTSTVAAPGNTSLTGCFQGYRFVSADIKVY